MNEKKVINLKIYENDLALLQAMIADHIRKLRIELESDHLDKEARIIIEQNIRDDRILFEKLNICKLYNE